MRDIAVTLFVVYFLPQAIKRPYIGVLLMCWFGYMNPHRMSFGFAYDFPFYYIITLCTLLFTAMAMARKEVSAPPMNIITGIGMMFITWLFITTFNAIHYQYSVDDLIKFLKILVGIILTTMVIRTREDLVKLVAVIVFSIGFFGIKGGVFSIVTGGNFRVWGPPGSFIEGNNELALGLLMIVPFFYFLVHEVSHVWIKRALKLCMLLIMASIVFSYSRGAFLAMVATMGFMWYRSRHKMQLAIAFVAAIVIATPFIPEQWYSRMDTIKTYQEDQSAMSRINSWTHAINIAKDRVTGAGFAAWGRDLFAIYAPNPDVVFDAHSIYFQVLGEHGFIGLLLFLMLFTATWFRAGKLRKLCQDDSDLRWCFVLMGMCQVSLIAYASGGAFLGLAFYDLPYHIVTFVIIAERALNKQLQGRDNQSAKTNQPQSPQSNPGNSVVNPYSQLRS